MHRTYGLDRSRSRCTPRELLDERGGLDLTAARERPEEVVAVPRRTVTGLGVAER